jgi:hypothetical protein
MTLHADNKSVDAGFDALDYGYANGKHAMHDSAIHAERDLWCAMIEQAFIDMGAIAYPAIGRGPQTAGYAGQGI